MTDAPADCRTLFAALPARFDGAAAGDWEAAFQFHIAGPRGGDFAVRVAGGACTAREGTDPDATTTVRTDDATWLGLVAGTVDPMGAFLRGKIKVQGNVGDLLRLQDPALFRRD